MNAWNMGRLILGPEPARGFVRVANAVDDYVDHFDQPGLQPIPDAR
jgi:hypothetical protein